MYKKIYNHLINFSEQNPFLRGLVPWTGFKQVQVNYHRSNRYKGKTGYSFLKMLNLSKKIELTELSMGMSSDYMSAIKYRSTFLRIGSKIFGSRN